MSRSSNRSALNQRTWILAAVILVSLGCQKQDIFPYFNAVLFNTKLRPDVAPLTNKQKQKTPLYMSDGGPNGRDVISELYHSSIHTGDLRQLRRSYAMWVEDDGFEVLSYEGVLDIEEAYRQRRTNHRFVGFAGGQVRDPETRQQIVVDGDPVDHAIIDPHRSNISIGLGVCTDGAARDDDYGPPEALDQGCQFFDMKDQGCAGQIRHSSNSEHPYAVLGCGIDLASSDASYTLEWIETKSGQNVQIVQPHIDARPHQVLPHTKVVYGTRTIARPLVFDGVEEKLEDDDPRGRRVQYERHFWSWQVPDVDEAGNLGGDLWEENFSPNLWISRVRIFKEGAYNPDTQSHEREYLDAHEIKVGGEGCEQDESSDVEPEGPQPSPEFLLESCTLKATPAYFHRDLDRKIDWRVEFRLWGDAFGQVTEEPPVKDNDPVYIEFELVDGSIGTSGSGLTASPAYVHLGDVSLAKGAGNFSRALRLTNHGFAPVRVTDLYVEGGQEDEFDAWTNRRLPRTLRPMESLDVTVRVDPTSFGRKTTQIVVQSVLGGQRSEIRASVAVHVADAIPDVAPTYLPFNWDGDRRANPLEYRRRFYLANLGHFDLHRTQAPQILGPDADAFAVVRTEYFPGVFEGPTRFRTIEPGELEFITVEFRPKHTGVHRAQVRIETNGGTKAVELDGWAYCPNGCPAPPSL